MQTVGSIAPIFALFNLGGGEIILIIALVIILFAAKNLPEITRGMGKGISDFRNASRSFLDEIDEGAEGAGKSLGGIYGKPAVEALTPDNQTAELYDPAVLRDSDETQGAANRKSTSAWNRLWQWVRHFLLGQ